MTEDQLNPYQSPQGTNQDAIDLIPDEESVLVLPATDASSHSWTVRADEHRIQFQSENGKLYDTKKGEALPDGVAPMPIMAEAELKTMPEPAAIDVVPRHVARYLDLMALAGKSPAVRAEECILGSKLIDVEERRRLAEGGAEALKASGDPLIALVQSLDAPARELRIRYENEVSSVQDEAYGKIAAARFAVFGDGVYPDATFTLRLSYGAIRGYTQGDATIAPFTQFGGVFEKARERAGEDWYTLPESWSKAAETLDMSTPFNFVSTHDIIGGNSGSPVIDAEGEVVGLIFDGNIQSLIGNYAYSDAQARSVSVDSRGIIGSLDQVYGAKRIVAELRGSQD